MVGSERARCGSTVVQTIEAPVQVVWSILRRFDNPQAYKQFVRSCTMLAGDGGRGSVRDISLVTGFPAGFSTERLDELDDECHVMAVSVIGGDHRLKNFRSRVTVREEPGRGRKAAAVVVEESYVVDVPEGNSEDETTTFADLIVRLDLRNLAKLTEGMAANHITVK